MKNGLYVIYGSNGEYEKCADYISFITRREESVYGLI
jgi:hypothetical protein